MLRWPALETRVTVRYRRPAGSVPPLTDTVGRLLQVEPSVRILTKVGAVVEIASADVVAVRPLTDTPIRTSQIRALEHAAALAQPGVEHRWSNGWFLRAGHGVTLAANSAVPLDISAPQNEIPKIAAWYARRGLPARLALPDRLLQVAGAAEQSHRLLIRDVEAVERDRCVVLSSRPDDAWLQGSGLDLEEVTAVVDGDVVFGTHPGMAIARAAVTGAPDQTRWVGVSALRLTRTDRGVAAAGQLLGTLLAWAVEQGASRAYLRASDDDQTIGRLAESLGFTQHHRGRYVMAVAS